MSDQDTLDSQVKNAIDRIRLNREMVLKVHNALRSEGLVSDIKRVVFMIPTNSGLETILFYKVASHTLGVKFVDINYSLGFTDDERIPAVITWTYKNSKGVFLLPVQDTWNFPGSFRGSTALYVKYRKAWPAFARKIRLEGDSHGKE